MKPHGAIVVVALWIQTFFNIAEAANCVESSTSSVTLNQICEFVFQGEYSCGGSYETSTFSFTQQDHQRNNPALMYNGACSDPSWDTQLNGDNMGFLLYVRLIDF
jgi:hypothetical protein